MARYVHQRWSHDESYPELRNVLASPYRAWPGEDIEALLAAEGLDAEDLEFSLRSLKRGLQSVGRVAAGALPVVGSVVGTALGGPVGTMIGGAAGRIAGQALGTAVSGGGSAAAGRAAGQAALGAVQGALGRREVPLPAIGGASPAMGQLLQMLARPETQRALIAMLLGQAGRRSVPVGGTPVPVSAFANTLGVLANRASLEYAEMVPAAGEGTAAYLMDFAGEAAVDPAVPEARAARLLELLAETDPEQDEQDEQDEAEYVEILPQPRAYRSSRQAAWTLDAYYDAIEQAEMALAAEDEW